MAVTPIVSTCATLCKILSSDLKQLREKLPKQFIKVSRQSVGEFFRHTLNVCVAYKQNMKSGVLHFYNCVSQENCTPEIDKVHKSNCMKGDWSWGAAAAVATSVVVSEEVENETSRRGQVAASVAAITSQRQPPAAPGPRFTIMIIKYLKKTRNRCRTAGRHNSRRGRRGRSCKHSR